ncbi:hypothetical protein M427DRAFT_56499 [Gonapodya prolifera JEL478]|uniref:Uncharacterized protein n=1 Tax=Gonapodya prolifera (strain JEL478) TaxID=1344416 RepID=A0A139AFX1_GONPJ|nr:hypothetical protein M427DRAFT_56499 [Gonapodya prolifera JEL478]|eukprot:KXS15660.1 hypothetical protein M427DRAFT_56499 [Gonapodya prolifera JEL478]
MRGKLNANKRKTDEPIDLNALNGPSRSIDVDMDDGNGEGGARDAAVTTTEKEGLNGEEALKTSSVSEAINVDGSAEVSKRPKRAQKASKDDTSTTHPSKRPRRAPASGASPQDVDTTGDEQLAKKLASESRRPRRATAVAAKAAIKAEVEDDSNEEKFQPPVEEAKSAQSGKSTPAGKKKPGKAKTKDERDWSLEGALRSRDGGLAQMSESSVRAYFHPNTFFQLPLEDCVELAAMLPSFDVALSIPSRLSAASAETISEETGADTSTGLLPEDKKIDGVAMEVST